MIDKKKRAIALHYDGKNAPKIIAKGDNKIAQEIIAIAKKYDIPLQEDDHLTALLSEVELNHSIPEELYIAVAQLLCFLYHVTGKGPQDY